MIRYWLTVVMAAFGTLIVTADPSHPSIAEAPEPSYVTIPASTSTTSITTTTIPPSTTTTTTVPAGDWLCPQWVPVALDAGFGPDLLPTLDQIMFRESTCHPDSYNGDDPNGGSRGLVQINGIWCEWWLQDRGILDTCDDLFDPHTNLVAALAIYEHSGWGPWGF